MRYLAGRIAAVSILIPLLCLSFSDTREIKAGESLDINKSFKFYFEAKDMSFLEGRKYVQVSPFQKKELQSKAYWDVLSVVGL